jgi:hypothetical protein
MKSMEQKVPGRVDGDFIAEVREDLAIDTFDLQAALIFNRATRAEESGSLAVEMGTKEQTGLG